MSSDSEDDYATDRSLANSTSLVFSDDATSGEDGPHSHRRKKHAGSHALAPPDEKLNMCEKQLNSCIEQGKSEKAFNLLIKLVPLRRLVFGDRHWKYAEAFTKLAKSYLDYKQYPTQAFTKAERAKDLILSCDSPASNQKIPFTRCLVETYLVLGKSLGSNHKYKEAESALMKSWQALKSLSKQMSSIQIPTATSAAALMDIKFEIKHALSSIYIATKDIDKAVSSLNFLVDELSKISDKDERLIQTYSQLGKAEKARPKSQVNHELVIEYALKAHNISTSNHPLHSVEVANTAFALGRAYSILDSEKTLNTGEIYLKEAKTAYVSSYGSKHEKTQQVQDALNKIWMRNGQEDDAMKALKGSLPVKRETFGECSSQVAESLKLIGGIYLSKGEIPKAVQFLKQSLTIEQELYGSQHSKTKATEKMLSQVEQIPGSNKSGKAKLNERPKFTSTIKSSR